MGRRAEPIAFAPAVETLGERLPPRVEVKTASLTARVRHYFAHHFRLFVEGLSPLGYAPLPALFAALVVGATVALPLAFAVLLHSAVQALDRTAHVGQVTLFLKMDVTPDALEQLITQLKARPEIRELRHVTPDQGLAELKAVAEVESSLALLENNPLPHAIVLQLAEASVAPEALRLLSDEFAKTAEVQRVQVDLEWAERFASIMTLLGQITWALAGLFGVAVIFVVGNTVRLAVDARREEIAVQLLVGASRAYVRRPFLYAGLWLGGLGSLVAWWFVNLGLWWIGPTVGRLAEVYGSDFRLPLLGWQTLLPVIAATALLGWVGAWLSVGHQLRRLSPT
jgi:cell division transport system permease protein